MVTVNGIHNAMKSDAWWLNRNSIEATIIRAAEARGYIRTLSQTQVEWTEHGIERARKELALA